MRKILLLSALWLMSLSAIASVVIPANDKGITYTGRINFTNPLSPLFVYPGTTIKANFTGSSIAMKAKAGSGYFMVTTDNKNPHKIFFGEKDSVITLASGLKGNNHSVEIMLSYEGYNARPEFRGFILDNGSSLLAPGKLPLRSIEYIGNSITCGYGVEAANGNVKYSDATENHYYSYAAVTSRALNARHLVVARSGIGIYRNYNGKIEGDENIMPHWYDYTSLYDNTKRWDFSTYSPDVVCINLGTNDLSTEPYDIAHFQSNYEKFVKHIRNVYPKAKIVMLTGSMLSGKALNDQRTAMNAALNNLTSQGLTGIYRFDFTPQTGALGYGADYHPSKSQQQKMSNELVPFIKKITGWK